MKWWGWADLIGRFLVLIGLMLQLDILQWFQSTEVNSYLIAILENQQDLLRAIETQSQPASGRIDLETTAEVIRRLRTLEDQQSVATAWNLALVGVGSVGLIVGRFFELKQ